MDWAVIAVGLAVATWAMLSRDAAFDSGRGDWELSWHAPVTPASIEAPDSVAPRALGDAKMSSGERMVFHWAEPVTVELSVARWDGVTTKSPASLECDRSDGQVHCVPVESGSGAATELDRVTRLTFSSVPRTASH